MNHYLYVTSLIELQDKVEIHLQDKNEFSWDAILNAFFKCKFLEKKMKEEESKNEVR